MRFFILSLLVYWSALANAADVIHTAPISEDLRSTDVRELKGIFTRKITRWRVSGENIVVFVKPLNSVEHKEFVIEWLGLTNYRYKKLLKQNIFSGTASSVKIIRSDEQMLLVISVTPNSIGYISNYMVWNNDSTIIKLTLD